MGQDKSGFFSESHIAVPGDYFHVVAICPVVIIKETNFYLNENDSGVLVHGALVLIP